MRHDVTSDCYLTCQRRPLSRHLRVVVEAGG